MKGPASLTRPLSVYAGAVLWRKPEGQMGRTCQRFFEGKKSKPALPTSIWQARMPPGQMPGPTLRARFEIGCQACSSPSRALASFKSRVSKPSVNQP
jgi:hypothetical protein